MPDKIDFFEVVARRKLGVGSDWRWCKSECVGEPPNHDFLIEGGVPRILKSGPRKGARSFKGVPLLKCVITRRELNEAHAQYEQRTGNCYSCQGTKQELARASADGREYRDCGRCKGTGASPNTGCNPKDAIA